MKLLNSLLLTSLFILHPVYAQDSSWLASWQASPQPVWDSSFAFPTDIPETVSDATFTQNVVISRGGKRLRLLVSNRYGKTPLVLNQTTISRARSQDNKDETPLVVRFGAKEVVSVPPGQSVASDPVNLATEDGASLQVSQYVQSQTPLTTFHWDGRQKAIFSRGNQTRTQKIEPNHILQETQARVFLTRIDVEGNSRHRAVAVLGDSITDGNGVPIDSNARLTDYMSKQLQESGLSVINAGISGARLLKDKMGENALARIQQDVFDAPGVKAVVIFMGINDISWPKTAFAPELPVPSLESLQLGYQKLVALAHQKGLRVIGVTLTPFHGALDGTPLANYYDTDKDRLRMQVNAWMRQEKVFDSLIDADVLLQDKVDPTKLDARYDSGDHLHPGPAGNEILARAISQRLKEHQ